METYSINSCSDGQRLDAAVNQRGGGGGKKSFPFRLDPPPEVKGSNLQIQRFKLGKTNYRGWGAGYITIDDYF